MTKAALRHRQPNRAPTAEPARLAALQVLNAVLKKPPQPLEVAIESAVSKHGLAERDRAFARLLVTTVLRRLGQLDLLLSRYVKFMPDSAVALNILRLGTCQLAVLETPTHAAVSTSVSLAKAKRRPEAGLINAVLRRMADDQARLDDGADARRANVPVWLWETWVRAYGYDAACGIAAAHLEVPPLDLAVKNDAAGWGIRLGGEVIGPLSVRLRQTGPVAALPGYDEGAWWVQDVAATLPVAVMGSVAGLRVLDLCAAPGGKTAQLVMGGAAVTAVEKDASRAQRLRDNLDRLQITADIVVADALTWDGPKDYDIVLLDAPCSATGTVRRNPDIPWHRSPPDVRHLHATQRDLLAVAGRHVRPGGRLVYATCSLQPEEGEQHVGPFLGDHPDFAASDLTVPAGYPIPVLSRVHGSLRTLPHPANPSGACDGFFIACFRKSD